MKDKKAFTLAEKDPTLNLSPCQGEEEIVGEFMSHTSSGRVKKSAYTLAETQTRHSEGTKVTEESLACHCEEQPNNSFLPFIRGGLRRGDSSFETPIIKVFQKKKKDITSSPALPLKEGKGATAFTLAETMIVLVILGVIASITIPAVVRRQMEANNRAKIKKSMTVYDTGINKIVIENQLKSDRAVQDWAGVNCENSINYFKVNSFSKKEDETDNLCRFRATDGVWWDISDILNPKVALKEKELDDDTLATTFTMSAAFDQNGSLRVNDRGFAPDNLNIKKIWNYVLKEKTQVCYRSKQITPEGDVHEYNSQGKPTANYFGCDNNGNSCTDSEKYEYDRNGNPTVYYEGCDGSGNNCSGLGKYDYDKNGNKTAEYYGCDVNGNNCSGSRKYDYDGNGNMIAQYNSCDGSGNNCRNSYKYAYDRKGNQTAYYYGCDGSGNNCRYSYKYAYDEHGNQTARYNSCGSNGNNCSNSTKYDYDGNGNMIAQYNGCDVSGNNCSGSNKYAYDRNGNQTAYYSGCDGSGNNCSGLGKYDYDKNGNKMAYYFGCDVNGNNCSGSQKYDYDEHGNITALYSGCNGNGNNCSARKTYQNTYVCE